ncbi:MAG: hypothetical protein AAGG68_01600 [Bacteroidota bacterium]
MNIKNIILASLLSVAFISCEKENLDNTFETQGVIEGADLALCACCGGWILRIDSDTREYRLEMLPEEIDQDSLPIDIKFDSEVNRVCGEITYLNIDRLELD